MKRPRVAIVHDYVTQRGGAERVVLSMIKAFPEAPVYTSLYDPRGTFPEFAGADIRPLPLNRIAVLRRWHRWAFPLLAPAFSFLNVDADVVLCSSSGWAHGVRTNGVKIVYCHTPARWLYQWSRYAPGVGTLGKVALKCLRHSLVRWDARSARSATCYIANSTTVRDRIRDCYGIEAEIVPPPYRLTPLDARKPLPAVDGSFFLCVSRFLPYKNLEPIIQTFAKRPRDRLLIVGAGPEERKLRRLAPRNVQILGAVTDAELRWLYARCSGIVAAAYEDYGLTPLEAAAFGKPSAVLHWGGFRDTVVEGVTGTFFDHPDPGSIGKAVDRLASSEWDEGQLRAHAARFSEAGFSGRLRAIVSSAVLRGGECADLSVLRSPASGERP